jgi:hypothetical protein
MTATVITLRERLDEYLMMRRMKASPRTADWGPSGFNHESWLAARKGILGSLPTNVEWDVGEVGDDVRRGCRSANELYTTVGSARGGVTRRAHGVLMPMRAVS